MHKISDCVELIFAVDVIARRIFPDYLPQFLLLNHGPDLVFPFIRILPEINTKQCFITALITQRGDAANIVKILLVHLK